MYECGHELFMAILVFPFVLKAVIESIISAVRNIVDDNDDKRETSWNSIKLAMAEMNKYSSDREAKL